MSTAEKSQAANLQLVPPAVESPRDKRDRIIEHAIIMFNQLGYDRVRVSDITDSLSMGKGTFYLYFRNKKELLLSCFEHVGELIEELESLPQIRDGDFFSKIGPRVESIGHKEWFPGLVNLLRAAELSPDEEIKVKAQEAYEIIAHYLRRDLREAIRAGKARDVDVDLAVYGFIGLAENLWYRSRFDDSYPPERVVEFAVDATTRLLSAEGAQEQEPVRGLEKGVHLVARDGTTFDLDAICFDGKTRLIAALGQAARVEIDPARVSRITVERSGEDCSLSITMADGGEVQASAEGSTEVSGAASLGAVWIALRDVRSIGTRLS